MAAIVARRTFRAVDRDGPRVNLGPNTGAGGLDVASTSTVATSSSPDRYTRARL